MTFRWIGALSALSLLAVSTMAHAALDTPVRTTGGLVQGTPGKTAAFETFKGIPYAAPPVGDLRWRPPEPAAPWAGVRMADKFAPDCFSLGPMAESTAGATSEDCLYLNVWTPAKTANEKLPVMVWIYGGAFVSGSAAVPRYDGDGLNHKGVILVSLSSRTGVLGFLSHPLLSAESPHHASGDYGVMDMVAALKWVRANIARFGGDPERVTIFGQSSGSQTVNLLTVSPLAKGLFQRAIGESGAGFGEREPKPLAVAEKAGAAYAAPLGATLAELRAQPPQALLAAAKRGDFEPVVDGWAIPYDPHVAFALGHQNDVPTLVGSNADEAQLSLRTTLETYRAQVHAIYGPQADAVLQRFPAATDDEARHAMKTYETIVLGSFNVGSWAAGELKTGRSQVYQYRFTHGPPVYKAVGSPPGPPSTGAAHGAELIYVFNNLDTQPRAWTDEDRALAATLSSYWVNFAKTGDPNGPGLPHWDSRRQTPDKLLEIGDDTHMITIPNTADVDFFEKIFYGANGIFSPSKN